MHGVKNVAQKNVIAANINAIRSAALTSIIFVRHRVHLHCPVVNTSVNKRVIRAVVSHAIVVHLMNCIVSAVQMLFIHQCLAEQNVQFVRIRVHVVINAIIKFYIIVIRHHCVHRV